MSVSARSEVTALRHVRVSRAALCALGVLIVAKIMVLVVARPSVSAAAVPVFVWHDVAIAAVWALMDRQTVRREWLWLLYAALVGYVAINVPVTHVLGSPLTWTMMQAAGGALSDSIAHYLTGATAVVMGAIVACGVALPRLIRHDVRVPRAMVAAAAATIVAGAALAPQVDTRGLERNAVTALLRWPRVAAATMPAASWRDSDAPAPAVSLPALGGTARAQNLLVVILESMAAQYLGLYGASPDPMPALSRLAQQSVVFDAAYAVYPESVKGLYATLCGRSPVFGVSMVDMIATGRAPCDPPARAFARLGYATSLVHSGRFAYLGMDTLVAGQGFDITADAGTISGRVQSSFGVDEASSVTWLLDWTRRVRDERRPFFAVYMPVAGHHPYAANTPGPFAGDDDLSRYRNAVHETDVALQSLLDGLQAQGTLDHTTIVVFGDHGEAFGQHPGNSGHTLFIHDENVRVPYVIRVPGVTSAMRVPQPVSVLDTMPTLMELVGLPVPDGIEGRSLLDPRARIAPFFADYSLGWLGLRDGCWKVQHNINAARSELFDVCRDPGERHDLAPLHPDRTSAYVRRLTAWR